MAIGMDPRDEAQSGAVTSRRGSGSWFSTTSILGPNNDSSGLCEAMGERLTASKRADGQWSSGGGVDRGS